MEKNKKKIDSELCDILNEIKILEQRMKKAKISNDKTGYEIALQRHEEIYKKYGDLIYKNSKPTTVFEKKF